MKPRNEGEVTKFWNFVADGDGNTAELLLYGEISDYSWYEDEITPAMFNKDMKEIGAVDEIIVRINSGGGDVFAAVAIYTRLKENRAKISVKIDGWCASAATIIAMAGDTVEIPAAGVFMIHDPAAGMYGYYNVADIEKVRSELETIKQSIVNCYMTRCGKTEDEIKALMSEEKWFTGQEAVDNGFCTQVMFAEIRTEVENQEKIMVNSVAISLKDFSTVPKGLLGCHGGHDNRQNTGKNKEDKEMTLEEFRTGYPEAAAAYKTEILAGTDGGEAVRGAVDAERSRIRAIDEMTLPGFEEMAAKAKFETPVSAEAFAVQVIAEQKKKGSIFLTDREGDIEKSGMKDVAPSGNRGFAPGEEEDPYGDLIDRMYKETE